MKEKKKEPFLREDATQYGEFISSFDKWIPPEEQKKKAKKLEDITGRGRRPRRPNRNKRTTKTIIK